MLPDSGLNPSKRGEGGREGGRGEGSALTMSFISPFSSFLLSPLSPLPSPLSPLSSIDPMHVLAVGGLRLSSEPSLIFCHPHPIHPSHSDPGTL